jgi:hypothetical protein
VRLEKYDINYGEPCVLRTEFLGHSDLKWLTIQ